MVRDIVLGIADELTVPFALAAGISGAFNATELVVIAGLAEIVAGTISMGLGGYLSAKSDADHYTHELQREHDEVRDLPETEVAEVRGILRAYGLDERESNVVADSLRQRPQPWQASKSATTIGLSYAIGGLIPLSPYFLYTTHTARW